MDYANERYVRLYIRETTNFRLLTEDGQLMHALVLKLMDRAGVFDLGGVSPVDAVAAALPKISRGRIALGLESLMERGMIEHRGDVLMWPNYIDGQETPQSDRQRQAEARARRRDVSRVVAVTHRDESSRTVTSGHETAQKRHAVSLPPSSPAQPIQKEDSVPTERPGSASPPESERRPMPPDPKEISRTVGVRLLRAAGVEEQHARSFLGRLAGEFTDAVLAEIVAAAVREKPIDPRGWIRKQCQIRGGANGGPHGRGAPTPKRGAPSAPSGREKWATERGNARGR